MKKILVTLYGVICYCFFILVFAYAEGFLLNDFVPKTINNQPSSDLLKAIWINLSLIATFGFCHSLMARSWFKNKLMKIIPKATERSTYVLQTSLLLALIMWQWQSMPYVIWSFDGMATWLFYVSFALGNIMILWSTFLINHFELFGLSQVWHNQLDKPMPVSNFKTPSLYKIVRHPMHLSVLIVFWSAPVMTVGHFIFSFAMTAYVLIGIAFEERSLKREFGEQYTVYKKRVPMIIPGFVTRKKLKM